jgi:protein-S-isoprenylcysteine O-methyltransferase Ste14
LETSLVPRCILSAPKDRAQAGSLAAVGEPVRARNSVPRSSLIVVDPFASRGRRDTVIAWTFLIVQVALLAAILLLPGGDAWEVPLWLGRSAVAVEAIGLVVLLVGLINLGRSLTPLPTPVAHGKLRTDGLYRFVRHPIYSGVIALTVGSAVRSGSRAVAVATVGLAVWFAVKARWEERKLRERYPEYAAYAAGTPAFVPFWPKRVGPPGNRSPER